MNDFFFVVQFVVCSLLYSLHGAATAAGFCSLLLLMFEKVENILRSERVFRQRRTTKNGNYLHFERAGADKEVFQGVICVLHNNYVQVMCESNCSQTEYEMQRAASSRLFAQTHTHGGKKGK